LHYTPTEQDYATVLRLYFWQRTSTKISLLAIVVIFCLVLYLIISQGTPPTIFELIWLFLPPLFVAFMFYFQPSRIARQAAQNEKLTAETTWIVGPEGIQISSRFGSTMMEWQTFGKLVTTKSYHLLLSRTN
jgi:hypothetical protein